MITIPDSAISVSDSATKTESVAIGLARRCTGQQQIPKEHEIHCCASITLFCHPRLRNEVSRQCYQLIGCGNRSKE